MGSLVLRQNLESKRNSQVLKNVGSNRGPMRGGDLLEELRKQETAVWIALVEGDGKADAKALADGFLGVYPDGFATKEDHVRQLDAGPTIVSFALSECRVLPIGKETAVISYRADFLRANRNESEAMYVSSIWRRSGDGWINIFSQDTPAQD